MLILASGSPRRAEILNSVGWAFTKSVPDIDESEIEGESAEDYVVRLAKGKAEKVAADMPGGIVLGADTTVVIGGQIVGKPVDMADAKRMIRLLAGNWHDVLTGVAVVNKGVTKTGLQRTRVKFTEMSDTEVDFLAEEGDPLDKAGAYAVQAQAALFIEGIEGDYWNVMGLPISLVYGLIMGGENRDNAGIGPLFEVSR
jgi:septum formation protein